MYNLFWMHSNIFENWFKIVQKYFNAKLIISNENWDSYKVAYLNKVKNIGLENILHGYKNPNVNCI